MIRNILIAGAGGAIGTMARYLCQRMAASVIPSVFPWGTLVVNVSGCLLIGLLWGFSIKNVNFTEDWKLFLMTGICGGFTTFSAFTLEATGLLRQQRTGLFFIYVGVSVIAGLLATYAGVKLARM